MTGKLLFRLAGVWLVVVAIGCTSETGRVPLQGKVNVEGEPLKRASISFIPADGPAANGEVVDGRYEFTAADGPVPGTQKVIIDSIIVDKFSQEPSRRWEHEGKVRNSAPFELNFELPAASSG